MHVVALVALALGSQSPVDSMLVSTQWVAERLGDPKLILLQVGDSAEYAGAHIPGARWLRYRDFAAPRDSTQPALELPSAERMAATLAAYGISDDSRIVLYWGNNWASPTTRIYLTLHWAGFGARTSILDGGLPAWRAEGRPVTTTPPAHVIGTATVRPRSDVVVRADEVDRLRIRANVALIDARTEQFYLGQDTSIARPGHIPGARNLPYVQVVGDDGYFKPRAELERLLRGAGADPGDLVVAYCHIGQQATAVWFAARLLGRDARLYDGSFNEWTGLPQYPVAREP